jgi:hypothetical protein
LDCMIRSGTTFINVKMEVARQWYCTTVYLHFEVMFKWKQQRKWLPRKRIKEWVVAVKATRETQVAVVRVSLNGDDSHDLIVLKAWNH